MKKNIIHIANSDLKKYKYYIGLGSNIGNREKKLELAINLISQIKSCLLIKRSSIYETDPVGYINQDKFLNMVISLYSGLEPTILLEYFQDIEKTLKRTREIRWGPRTIDIDILLCNNLKINTEKLTIPHPRMFEREFVLIPLKEIYDESDIIF